MASLGDYLNDLDHLHESFQGRALISIIIALGFLSLDITCRAGPFRTPIRNYFAQKNAKLTKAELNDIVSGSGPRAAVFLHNVVCSILACFVLSIKAHRLDPFYATSTASTLQMMISAGYFLYDAVTSIYDVKREGVEFVVHGVACMTVYNFGFLAVRSNKHPLLSFMIRSIFFISTSAFLQFSNACIHISPAHGPTSLVLLVIPNRSGSTTLARGSSCGS